MLGHIDDLPEVEIPDERVQQALVEIKRAGRQRRVAMAAPLVFVAAVLTAMIAAPPQHGGLALVADADDVDPQLPAVFGSNGVWRLAEPIAEAPTVAPGPASIVEAPTPPLAPSYSLVPPTADQARSLPTSTSTPPSSTSGQSLRGTADAGDASALTDAGVPAGRELDWSQFTMAIRIEELDQDPDQEQISTPEPVAVAAEVTAPAPEAQEDSQANPSTPAASPTVAATPTPSAPATIVLQSVLVYSAHVSVTVQVTDVDSDVIDWCNTRIDWGDGSISGMATADELAMCAAPCEHEALSSAAGPISDTPIDETFTFEHEYTQLIDAAPKVFVATGDGCSYTLAELHLSPFTVDP